MHTGFKKWQRAKAVLQRGIKVLCNEEPLPNQKTRLRNAWVGDGERTDQGITLTLSKAGRFEIGAPRIARVLTKQ